jgi:hypothetical protein
MKYAVEMGSDAILYVTIFINTFRVFKFVRGKKRRHIMMILQAHFYFFQYKVKKLKIQCFDCNCCH